MTTINTGSYIPYMGPTGASGQTPADTTTDGTGANFQTRSQAINANGAIGDNLAGAAGGGDPSDISSLPPDQQKKALEQMFPGNGDQIAKLLQQHPGLDLQSLQKLDGQSLGQLVSACSQHPQWDPNSLISTDANGKPQISDVLKNPQALDLMNRRSDIQPQDLEKIENSCATATTDGNGQGNKGAADQMFGDAIKLLSTRTDIKPDDVNDLIGKTASYFGGDQNQANQGQNIANGFDKVTNALSSHPGMTAANMDGMMSTLQNHFKDPKQRSAAFDSGMQMMEKSGNDPTQLDNMLVNSERNGKEGPAKLKDFQANAQAVSNGTANIAGVTDPGGFAKGTPGNPATTPGQPGQPGQKQQGPGQQGPGQQQGAGILGSLGQPGANDPGAGAGAAPGGGATGGLGGGHF